MVEQIGTLWQASSDTRSLLARLWLAVFCGYLALGATLQVLPGYLRHHFGAGTFVVGATVGLAFAGTAVGRPFAGRAGDVGYSRGVAAAGGLTTAIAAAGHLLAPNLFLLLVARLAMGFGEAALFSATLPRVLAVTSPATRGRISGWFGLSMWGGLSLGPLLAALLMSTAGTTAAWSAVIALPLVSSALTCSTPKPTVKPGRLRPHDYRLLLPSQVLGPGATLGLAAFGYGTLAATLVLFLSQNAIGGQSLGLATFSVTFLVSRAAGSPVVDRHGGRATARATVIIEALGLTILAIAGSEPVALTGAALTGVGLGIVYPATIKQTLGRVAVGDAGSAVGAMTSCWDLGILFAGPLSGAIAAGGGFSLAFATAAAASMLACLINSFPQRTKSERMKSPTGCVEPSPLTATANGSRPAPR
jgi:MFS family permease